MNKQQGYIEGIVMVIFVAIVIAFVWALLCMRIATSEQIVSGIVYNNTNNGFLSGNTNFSVRASENTVITEENQSSYCLPPSSPYIELVNKAAVDKSIKVVVTTEKMFEFVAHPLACSDNVTVKIQE